MCGEIWSLPSLQKCFGLHHAHTDFIVAGFDVEDTIWEEVEVSGTLTSVDFTEFLAVLHIVANRRKVLVVHPSIDGKDERKSLRLQVFFQAPKSTEWFSVRVIQVRSQNWPFWMICRPQNGHVCLTDGVGLVLNNTLLAVHGLLSTCIRGHTNEDPDQQEDFQEFMRS